MSMGQETCRTLKQVLLNLLCWKKNLQKDICGPGGDWQENSLHPGQIIYGQSSGSQWESTPSWKRSKSGPMKNSIWRTHENYEGSISSTLRIRNSKKPIKIACKKLGTSVAPAMPCKIVKKNFVSGASNKIKNKTFVSSGSWWIQKNCVWENLYQIIMKTILKEIETNHYNILNWFTNSFLCLNPYKFQQQKQQWTRNGKNWRNFRRGTWQKSGAKRRWSMKQGRRVQKFILHHWWTCHLKNAELKVKHQK